MIFKCKNCGGNAIYSPEKKSMFCPYCDSINSEEKEEHIGQELRICPNCSGEVPVLEHASTTQCPYCDSYLIFDERVTGQYMPKKMIPFQMGKESCKQALRDKFKKNIFAPTDFLSEARLNSMQGIYVPFWFYDYNTNVDFVGEATKVKSWTTGSTRYTETSYYNVVRNMDIHFKGVPVDASIQMPDDVMDLVEPYTYAQLEDFKPEYLSGFFAEKYNMTADLVESRANQKMDSDAKQMLNESVAGYGSVKSVRKQIVVRDSSSWYGLLPVWKYNYKYKDKEYPFYVNGQTGKIVGTAPLSKTKIGVYSTTLWALMTAIMLLINSIFRLI